MSTRSSGCGHLVDIWGLWTRNFKSKLPKNRDISGIEMTISLIKYYITLNLTTQARFKICFITKEYLNLSTINMFLIYLNYLNILIFLVAWLISLVIDFSFKVCFLSYCFLPFARPIKTLT